VNGERLLILLDYQEVLRRRIEKGRWILKLSGIGQKRMKAKRWRRIFLVFATCLFMGWVAVSVAQRWNSMAERGKAFRSRYPALAGGTSSEPADPLTQDILEKDRNFLNELFQKQTEDDHQAIELSRKSIPRAELIVNSAIVRRGELVVRDGTSKHKLLSIAQ
jgi:hypothetical protein